MADHHWPAADPGASLKLTGQADFWSPNRGDQPVRPQTLGQCSRRLVTRRLWSPRARERACRRVAPLCPVPHLQRRHHFNRLIPKLPISLEDRYPIRQLLDRQTRMLRVGAPPIEILELSPIHHNHGVIARRETVPSTMPRCRYGGVGKVSLKPRLHGSCLYRARLISGIKLVTSTPYFVREAMNAVDGIDLDHETPIYLKLDKEHTCCMSHVVDQFVPYLPILSPELRPSGNPR